ncbi:MAG TPA: FAD-binding oxidoreductase [Stellaceae bacterium]|nr:FAD-binding oxidoreductase [Stellaceae bacterium]
MTGLSFDTAVIGAGVMGASTALHLARAGMRTVIIDRGAICREASGVNAGTLTLHMTRAALIPYAMAGRQRWIDAPIWLGADVGGRAVEGMSVAFTPAEAEMVEQRAKSRREQGAPIEVISPARARAVEPGLNERVILAAYSEIDGYASAYLTGRAYRAALVAAGAEIREATAVVGVDRAAIDRTGGGFTIRTATGEVIRARRLVLAGGVWLEQMLGWIDVTIPVKCLINQLIVTERVRPVMRTVLGVASGLLSLKQFENGTVLIGGGWQGIGDTVRGGVEAIPDNLMGNMRLARYTIPALAQARIARIWLGLESETSDALPMIGAVPGVPDAYVIGCVHSGYTSGPYMGELLAELILGKATSMPLFDPARLVTGGAPVRSGSVA